METAKLVADRNGLQGCIMWTMFVCAWVWKDVQASVLALVRNAFIKDVYIGATEDPWWRFSGCEDYDGNSDFKPHKEKYDRMYVLLIDVSEAAHDMEEELIDVLRSCRDTRPKVTNALKYVQGGTRSKVLFLYACVNVISLGRDI